MKSAHHILITCEHGGNLVPPAYRGLFARYQTLLLTHQAFDAGALTLAKDLAARLNATLFYSKTTRLLVDLNRSLGHPQLLSAITRKLSPAARHKLIALHYRPYRAAIESHVAEMISRRERVIHFASHSFSPELNGRVREADIGLLYDPAREGEAALAQALKTAIESLEPSLKVRRNVPYKGTSDGLTAALRRVHPEESYLGIELEVNQKHVLVKNRHWPRLRSAVIKAVVSTLADFSHTRPRAEGD
ncbi:MAG: hypothetical protein RIR70_1409 [Pseudomonadota bacterium]|jgi:predicted N-formylglutamate amidohydrolase